MAHCLWITKNIYGAHMISADTGFWVALLDRRDNLHHMIGETEFPKMALLMHQYADLPMDLADASLILLAEYLGHGRIVSSDRRDFNTYRWKNHHPVVNLVEDL